MSVAPRGDNSSGETRPRLGAMGAFRGAAVLGASLVGVTSGIAGLATGGRLGPAILRIVAVVCILYVIVNFVNTLLAQEHRQLRRRLEATRDEFAQYKAAADSERQRYMSTVKRLVDRQSLLYAEDLEVTIEIGADDANDRIVERHTTTPTPFLFYRSMRPVVPTDTPEPLTFDDLDLTIEIENGDGTTATVLPLVEAGREVRILIVFDPLVSEVLTWTLSYRPRGLWASLRRDGVDALAWDARTPNGRLGDCTFTTFAVRFCFPEGIVGAVAERGQRGTVTRQHDGAGHATANWSEQRPEGRRYEWDLTFQAV